MIKEGVTIQCDTLFFMTDPLQAGEIVAQIG